MESGKSRGHIVGCSTPEFPSRSYILNNPTLFMSKDQTEPLRTVRAGGGVCARDDECGLSAGNAGNTAAAENDRGAVDVGSHCSNAGVCVCGSSLTGPHCRVRHVVGLCCSWFCSVIGWLRFMIGFSLWFALYNCNSVISLFFVRFLPYLLGICRL